MPAITFKIDGLQAVIASVEKIGVDAEKKLQKRLNEFAIKLEKEAKERVAVDESFLKNSIQKEIGRLSGGVVVTADYAAYVEFGTKKFAAKYVASLPQDWKTYAATFKGRGGGSIDDFLLRIFEWVKRKGFAAYETKGGNRSKSKNSLQAEESSAYIIALRILQNGSRAHPFLFPAYVIAKKQLEDHLKEDFK